MPSMQTSETNQTPTTKQQTKTNPKTKNNKTHNPKEVLYKNPQTRKTKKIKYPTKSNFQLPKLSLIHATKPKLIKSTSLPTVS
jgi:hypothetical protein